MTELAQYLPAYVQALGVTLWLSLCAAFGGMLLGFAINGLCGKRGLAFRLWRVYVWAIRGTPFLAQLAVIYFGLPSLGIMLSAVEATLLSLTLYSAAYFGEIFAPRGTASRRDNAKRRWPTTSLRVAVSGISRCRRPFVLRYRC
jgi:polar amino acid transport system permease protein/cystine transport system permease protein